MQPKTPQPVPLETSFITRKTRSRSLEEIVPPTPPNLDPSQFPPKPELHGDQ